MKKIYIIVAMFLLSSSIILAQDTNDLDAIFNETSSPTPKAVVNTNQTGGIHGAGEIMIDGISHTVSADGVTVTWNAITGSYKINVDIKNTNIDNDYSNYSKVTGSDAKVFIKLSQKGSYSIRLTPIDDASGLPAGVEKVYKVEFSPVATDPIEEVLQPQPEAPKPVDPAQTIDKPKVGVFEDLMYILMISIIGGYIVYNYRKNDISK